MSKFRLTLGQRRWRAGMIKVRLRVSIRRSGEQVLKDCSRESKGSGLSTRINAIFQEN